MKTSKKVLSLLLAGFLASAMVAHADTFNFFPSSSAGDGQLGNSAVYTSGAHSITAYGFACTSYFGGGATGCLNNSDTINWYANVSSANLYQKNDGTDERGLGIKNDPLSDHEISSDDFIDLDLTNLGSTIGTLTISSLQANESFMFCYGNSHSGWNSNDCSSTFVGSGTNFVTGFNLNGYHDISLIGVSSDVLLASVTTQPAATPEPSSLMLLGTGIVGAAGMLRRRMLTNPSRG